MVKGRFRRHLFLITMVVLVVVFTAGILFGISLSKVELNTINDFIKENELNTESYIIEQDLIKEFQGDNCALAKTRINELSSEIGNIGRTLTEKNIDKKLGKDNYHFLKLKYHLLQIKTYILFNKLIKNCGLPNSIILYYYTIGDKGSTEQGFVLDRLVKDSKLTVFAIEYNYSPELYFLESYYNITATPTMIINYKTKMEGSTSYEKIENELILADKNR